MSNLLSIKGRTAFVTGAGQGVGRQAALYLAEHGAGAIVVNDFHAERAESVAAEVEAAGAKALPLAFDVSDFDAVGAAFAETQTTFGGVDILVNNAGNAGPTSRLDDLVPFWESDPDEWRRWMATNFDGVLNCTRHAMPLMVKCGYGRIVTVIFLVFAAVYLLGLCWYYIAVFNTNSLFSIERYTRVPLRVFHLTGLMLLLVEAAAAIAHAALDHVRYNGGRLTIPPRFSRSRPFSSPPRRPPTARRGV